MTDLDKIVAFAKAIKEKPYNLDALIQNVAIVEKFEDKFISFGNGVEIEKSLMTNFFGQFYLTHKLIDELENRDLKKNKNQKNRLIYTGSNLYSWGAVESNKAQIKFNPQRPKGKFEEFIGNFKFASRHYFVAKYGVTVLSQVFAKYKTEIDVYILHPTPTNSDIWVTDNTVLDVLFNAYIAPICLREPDVAAQRLIYCAFGRENIELQKSGTYYEHCKQTDLKVNDDEPKSDTSKKTKLDKKVTPNELYRITLDVLNKVFLNVNNNPIADNVEHKKHEINSIIPPTDASPSSSTPVHSS